MAIQRISRRDFVKGSLVGSGSALLSMASPASFSTEAQLVGIHPWNGYAGVGDYALSNGNVESTRSVAHLLRDGKVQGLLEDAIEIDQIFDLVVVGGGFAGLSAARTFSREAGKGRTCLLLENHPLPGGEAKRNDFEVDGYRLSAPQGSNVSVVPSEAGSWYANLWHQLGIPSEPSFQSLTGVKRDIRVATTNYVPMFGLAEQTASAGYFFDKDTFGLKKSYWDIDSSITDYANTPFTAKEKSDLAKLHRGCGKNLAGDDWQRWLDSITYREYLSSVLGIEARVIRWLDTTLSTTGGIGSDALSARFAMIAGSPGFDIGFGGPSLYRFPPGEQNAHGVFSFPGGNDAIYRLMLKSVKPSAIAGGASFEEIHNGAYVFSEFDHPDTPVRLRVGATALQIAHLGDPETAEFVSVVYEKEGRIYRVRARSVVSSVGGWVNKHLVQGLPQEYSSAYNSLIHGSNMIINVALRNWRPMGHLGVSACHFFSNRGVGSFCNIKRPMITGDNSPPLNPNKPAVLTFYAGFPKSGLSAKDQAAAVRWELLSKSYAEIESSVVAQLEEMFGSFGFDADRDIAGITVNRWGHSYIVSAPGFFFGSNGRPAPQTILTEPFGRISFGHSENNGIQEWFGAVEHGERAARQAMKHI